MKRFELCDIDLCEYDMPLNYEIMDNGVPLSQKQVCELLNELHEENQDLKSFNEDLAENLSACANARISKDDLIETLRKENKKLKKLLLIKRVKENTRVKK